jgi:hypothetical protein
MRVPKPVKEQQPKSIGCYLRKDLDISVRNLTTNPNPNDPMVVEDGIPKHRFCASSPMKATG